MEHPRSYPRPGVSSLKPSPLEFVAQTETFVRDLLEKELSPSLLYHDLQHTVSVVEAATQLAEMRGLNAEQREDLQIAAWLHDTGFTETYAGHEDVSKRIGTKFLRGIGFPEQRLQRVLECIEVTKLGNTPDTMITRVMKDADFNNLGQRKYTTTVENLRHEREVYFHETHTDLEWYETNADFITAHHYYTDEAQKLYGERKLKNLKKVQKAIKKMKKAAAKAQPLDVSINSNKSAQMMFKTALRNHIDLTNIADNKSNMMIQINALIITISLPLLVGTMDTGTSGYLLIPAAILLVTCVLSIIFATLATRPVKTEGLTTIQSIKTGKSNLFFFGNYYRMTIDDYRLGVQTVIADQEILDNSIMADLFYLGKSLGGKFNRLRICYAIFGIGMTLTVVAFGVTYALVRA